MTNKEKKVNALKRVAIVDDDDDIRLYFKDILQAEKDFKFAGEFSNAAEALSSIPHSRPDLVLMDVCLPDLCGIECTRHLKHRMPDLKIVILTGMRNANFIKFALQAGADAYLTKPVTAGQYLATMRFAVIDQAGNESGFPKSARELFPMAASKPDLPLSPRENEILDRLADGLLYKEISDKLGISYAMVHKYQHKIFQKLHVSNRSEAIRLRLNGGCK